MAISISGSSSQSTNEGANQSTVSGSGSMTLTVGNWSGLQSWGRVWIGGAAYDTPGPTSMSQGGSWGWGSSRTYTHDANGYRGAVDVSVEFWVDGTTYHRGSAGAGTQGAVDFNRAPGTPSSVTAVVNADKTITVTAAAVGSPAGTPTYYFAYQANGGTWSAAEANGSLNVKAYTLTPGSNYAFRVYATNSDGTGGTTTSSSVFLPSGGKIYNGTAWVPTTTAKIYNGTAWVDLSTAKIYNGTSWVNLT